MVFGKLKEIGQKFQPDRFLTNLVRNFLTESMEKLFAPWGPERMARIIDEDMDFLGFFPPEDIEALFQEARQYGFAIGLVTDEMLIECSPEWLQKVVSERGEKGVAWVHSIAEKLRQGVTGQ